MVEIPSLTTERLTLRAPRPGDFPALREFYASPRSAFVGGPKTAEDAWRMLATELGHWHLRGFGRWAVEETESGRFVGLVGPWYPEGWPEPEIGWDLMAGFEGRGYATEAARAALSWAFDARGWETAVSLISPENVASKGVAQRLGARHERMVEIAPLGTLELWRHPRPEAAR